MNSKDSDDRTATEVRDTLNRSLLGWSNYFCLGTRRSALRSVDQYVYLGALHRLSKKCTRAMVDRGSG